MTIKQTKGGTGMKTTKRTQREVGRDIEAELETNGWGSPRLAELEREFWEVAR